MAIGPRGSGSYPKTMNGRRLPLINQSHAIVHSTKGGIAMIKFEKSMIINRPVEEVWKLMSKERIA